VDNRFIAAASALLVAGGIAGCSSPSPIAPPKGTLPAGTAQVTINDTGLGTTHAVSCTVVGRLTTIKTGDDKAGTVSSVDNSDGVTVQSAEISNLGGFTGSYWADLGTPTKVEITGRTYLMTGSATGFNADSPIRTTESFSIRVAC
jgi:hypothetical protein